MIMSTYDLNCALTAMIQRFGYDLLFTAVKPAIDGIVMYTSCGNYKYLYNDCELHELSNTWRKGA